MGARQPMGVRVLANCNMVNRIVLGWGAGQWQADAGTIVQPRRRPIAEAGTDPSLGTESEPGVWRKWALGSGVQRVGRWRGSTVVVELG